MTVITKYVYNMYLFTAQPHTYYSMTIERLNTINSFNPLEISISRHDEPTNTQVKVTSYTPKNVKNYHLS